jgi:predicted PurR-regulated permease PerM
MNPKPSNVRVTVSNRTVLRVIVLIIVAYLAVKFVIRVDHILELIFLSIFLSIALNPAVSWIARNLKLKSRSLVTGIAYLIVVLITVGFFALTLPPLIHQTEVFISDLPKTINNLKNQNSEAGKFVHHYKLEKAVSNLSKEVSSHSSNLVAPVWATASKIGQILASILIVFVLTFMMIVEGPIWLERYWKLRVKKQDWHVDLASRMYKIITGYVNGQLLLALLDGLVTLISLIVVTHILHASVNDVALAGIITITGLIPMVGHIFGSVIVVIACLFVSWPLALIMGIILLVYMELASVTIQPYIQAKYNDLSPMLVLIAALLGIAAGGILGAFVAIPIAGCIKVAAKEYLQHKEILD